MPIEFFFDVVCPWAYLAAIRVESFAASLGQKAIWRPVLLGGLFRHHGAPQVATVAQARRTVGINDLYRHAERWGIPLEMHPEHPRRTVDAMRLVTAAESAARPALALDLYRAYFVHQKDISDRAVLAEVAAAHGLDLAVVDTEETLQALTVSTQEAAERGVFGVPTFIVEGELFWGVDRWPLIERALRANGARIPQRPPAAISGRRLEFFHDCASPYSYLASTQVDRIAARHGVTVRWTPVLLGGLFRDIGTLDAPILAMTQVKQRYLHGDMVSWAQYWGVPFRFPAQFPVRTVVPLRVALVEPRVTPVLYRAVWAEGRDIGDAAVLGAVLRENGFDAEALLDAAQDLSMKRKLRENNDRAVSLGVCGVPTFLVDARMLVWGQDRFEHVEAALQGWLPERG